MEEKKSYKTLNIIAAVLMVFLIALTCYKVFIFDKKDNKNNKDNPPVEEKENNNQYPLINNDFLKEQVLNMPLFNIAKYKETTYKQLYEGYVINMAMQKLTSQKSLSKEELEKTIFKTLSTSQYEDLTKDEYAVYYNGKEVVDKVKELYNYDLKLETKDYGGCQVVSLNNVCDGRNYDKTIDKFIAYNSGGVALKTTAIIIDEKETNNIYTVKYAISELWPDDEDTKENDYTNLPQYEVSFKIDGNSYEFVDIKAVDNKEEEKENKQCSNTPNMKYSESSSSTGIDWISLKKVDNKYYLLIDWVKANNIYGDVIKAKDKNEFLINNLDVNKVKSYKIISTYNAVGNEYVMFLMTDGTLEYIPIYKALTESEIKSYGRIKNVDNVVELVSASASPIDSDVGNYVTTIAKTSDGNCYNLYVALQKSIKE